MSITGGPLDENTGNYGNPSMDCTAVSYRADNIGATLWVNKLQTLFRAQKTCSGSLGRFADPCATFPAVAEIPAVRAWQHN
jgi:hypothetical protein